MDPSENSAFFPQKKLPFFLNYFNQVNYWLHFCPTNLPAASSETVLKVSFDHSNEHLLCFLVTSLFCLTHSLLQMGPERGPSAEPGQACLRGGGLGRKQKIRFWAPLLELSLGRVGRKLNFQCSILLIQSLKSEKYFCSLLDDNASAKMWPPRL